MTRAQRARDVEHDEEQQRYCTLEQAKHGHREWIEQVMQSIEKQVATKTENDDGKTEVQQDTMTVLTRDDIRFLMQLLDQANRRQVLEAADGKSYFIPMVMVGIAEKLMAMLKEARR